MSGKKSNKLLISLIYTVLAVAVVYFFGARLLVVFAPFFLAYLIAAAVEPLVRLLTERLRFNRRLASALCIFLTVFIIGGLLYWLVAGIVSEIKSLAVNWPVVYQRAEAQASMYANRFSNFYYSLQPDVRNYLATAYSGIKSQLSSWASPMADAAIGFTTSAAAKLPSGLIFSIVMFLAAYFISSDRKGVREGIQKLVGKKIALRISKIISDLKNALGGYVKAQLIIMSVTSVIVSAGLLIAGVPYAVLIALVIALFDALPVFGSGGILIPWSIISFMTSDPKTGITLLIIYVVIIITRQMLEPRIIGRHIGVPPLLTLVAMYAGLKLIGIIGMILGPALVVAVRSLYKAGIFSEMFGRPEARALKSEGEQAQDQGPDGSREDSRGADDGKTADRSNKKGEAHE